MSNKPIIVPIAGRARPSSDVLRRMAAVHGPGHPRSVVAMLDNEIAVDSLAALLDEAMSETVTKDGRLDLKDVAARVLRRMKESPTCR